MDYTMYDTLLQLSVFQGISRRELTEILDKVQFEFVRYKAGERFIKQGDNCDKLTFLLSGEVESSTRSSNGLFTLDERIGAPYTIEPYSLFGMANRYRSSYAAASDASILKIDKRFIYRELSGYPVFKINMVNSLSNRAQAELVKAWDLSPLGIGGRIARLIYTLCELPLGTKRLHIKMEDLAALVGETRLNVSRVLNDWEKRGMARLQRKEITIVALEELLNGVS